MLIERKVFLAAYTIRKLFEAQKLSTSLRDQSLRCWTYPAISDMITLHSVGLDKLYNLGSPEERVITWRDLIDLIIHSFIFSELLAEDWTVEGFFVHRIGSAMSGFGSLRSRLSSTSCVGSEATTPQP
jgi:hypothetical protein